MGNQLSQPLGESTVGFGVQEMKTSAGPVSMQGARFIQFGGSDADLLERVDNDKFDPVVECVGWGGDFTVSIDYTPNNIVGGGHAISKDGAWYIQPFNANVNVKIYNTGGLSTNFTATGFLQTGVTSKLVLTYHYDEDSSSDLKLYVNHETPVSSAIARGPIKNSTFGLAIGAREDGTNTVDGILSNAAFRCGAYSAMEVSKLISPYYPGVRRNNVNGMYVTTCTQAASHATCSHQHCRPGQPNLCEPDMTGALPVYSQQTQEFDNNYFGTNTNTQDNPDYTGIWYDEVTGDGTASFTEYFGDSKYGDSSARATITGTTSSVEIYRCLTAGTGADLYGEVSLKVLEDTDVATIANGDIHLRAYQFTSGDCSTGWIGGIDIVDLSSETISGGWQTFGGLIAAVDWDVTANSYYFYLTVSGANADILIDNVSVKIASYHTPFIPCPSGAGTCSTNERNLRLHNPLSDYIEEEGGFAYESGFCISMWVYSDWEGDGGVTHQFLNIPSTAGVKNLIDFELNSFDLLSLRVYDGASTYRQSTFATTSTNWSAGWHYVEGCSNNSDDTLAGHHYNVANTTWYDWSTSGGGTGIQDGQSSILPLGVSSTTADHLDGYIYNFYVAPYNAIFPNHGFNNGVAPNAPY